MIEVQKVCFGYENKAELLKDISFSASQGDVVCLLGPNGAGKTTLLRCLLHLHAPSSGKILLEGNDIRGMHPKEKARYVAYVPQSATSVFSYRVMEVVVMGRTPYLAAMTTPTAQDQRIADEALEQLGIAHLADRHMDELSGGERQMVLIARALAQQSRILIMDEPTSSLDYGNQVRILKLIQGLARQNYTIIMSSHFPDHAFLAGTQVLLMKNGAILAGGEPDMVVTTEHLTQLYGTAIQVIPVEADEATGRQVKICRPVIEQQGDLLFYNKQCS